VTITELLSIRPYRYIYEDIRRLHQPQTQCDSASLPASFPQKIGHPHTPLYDVYHITHHTLIPMKARCSKNLHSSPFQHCKQTLILLSCLHSHYIPPESHILLTLPQRVFPKVQLLEVDLLEKHEHPSDDIRLGVDF
jgi:hypothetical protein